MTDNEIIKALECCFLSECDCKDCPYRDFEICDTAKMINTVIDLIKRQQAEIERLKIRKKEYAFCNLLGNCLVYSENLKDYNKMRIDLKAEAIKEFAERLKTNHITKDDKGKVHLLIEYDEFDNLVKEMVGDEV